MEILVTTHFCSGSANSENFSACIDSTANCTQDDCGFVLRTWIWFNPNPDLIGTYTVDGTTEDGHANIEVGGCGSCGCSGGYANDGDQVIGTLEISKGSDGDTIVGTFNVVIEGTSPDDGGDESVSGSFSACNCIQ